MGLMRLISPHRAEIQDIVSQAVGPSGYATVSVLPSATIVHVLLIAFYISVFLLVRELTWRRRQSPWATAAPLLLVAFGEAALGWIHYISAAGASPASGTFINRNHFAGMLEMSLPFAVMYAAAALVRDRGSGPLPTASALRASLGMGLATVILMGIVFSFSRSGFSAALAGILAMVALGGGRSLSPQARKAAVVLILTAVVAAFFLLPPDAFIRRFADISSLEEVRSQDRFELWSETWNLVKDYPLVGCGLGAYRTAFLEFKITMPMVLDDHPHNDYLQCLAEMGILGALIVAIVAVGFVRSALVARIRHQNSEGRCLAIACFGAMFSIALHSITDFNLYLPANAMLLAWVAGIASGLEAASKFDRVREV
jgi:O-antigen ligase